MLRRQDRPLFAALLAVVLALVLSWTVPSPYSEPNQNADKCATYECREDAATEALAEYTKWLVIATAALAFFSILQGVFLIRGDRLTRRSIELARDEFNATHRAKIFVQTVTVTDKGSRTVHNGQHLQTPAKAIITIANGGDAHAFIIEWRAVIYYQGSDAAFNPGLDVEPLQRPEMNAAGISPGEFQELGHSQMHAVDDEWDTFVHEGGKMFFIGRVTYQGADGTKRNTGFCRQYDPEDAGAWRPTKDSEYEYAY